MRSAKIASTVTRNVTFAVSSIVPRSSPAHPGTTIVLKLIAIKKGGGNESEIRSLPLRIPPWLTAVRQNALCRAN